MDQTAEPVLSHNQEGHTDKAALLQTLKIGRLQALMYTLAGLGVTFYGALLYRGIGSDPGTADAVYNLQDYLDQFTLNASFGRVTAIITAALFGAVLYILVWMLVVVIVDIYNNVVVSFSYRHPKSFHHSDFWLSIIGRTLFRAAIGVVTLVCVGLALFGLLPLYLNASAKIWSGAVGSKDALALALLFTGTVATCKLCYILVALAVRKTPIRSE